MLLLPQTAATNKLSKLYKDILQMRGERYFAPHLIYGNCSAAQVSSPVQE